MAKRYTEQELDQIERDFRALVSQEDRIHLVIDESLTRRKALVNALKKAGCTKVEEAQDGMEALDKLKNTSGRVVPIVELNNSVMDGIQFMKHFRSLEAFADCPVILTSGETRKERIVAAIKAGATAFLKRPFQPDALIEKLKGLDAL